MGTFSKLLDSLLATPGEFIDVATAGPAEAILVLFGALFIAPPLIFFAILVLGAVVDLVTPESFGATHPEA